MPDHTVAEELLSAMQAAAAALAAGDLAAADQTMALAAAACRQLTAAGVQLTEAELGALRTLDDNCGETLAAMASDVNAAGFEDEHRRRGLAFYQRGV